MVVVVVMIASISLVLFDFLREFVGGRLVEGFKDVSGINDCHDTVKIDAAVEAFVHPEHGCYVAWIRYASGFEQDIVE